ncbi:hypothetical protein FACS189444_6860 [Spirochaetia bacterium]|nr:hypothetical protein FACS189444_6860 [Spirochaetia bacterium]
MGKLVANEACTFQSSAETWSAPPVVTGLGNPMCKPGGSPVLNGPLSVPCPAWLPGTGDTTPGVAGGPFVFTPTVTKVKSGGKFVLVEMDESAQVMITWANAPPNVPPRVALVTLKIAAAGQTKMSAS